MEREEPEKGSEEDTASQSIKSPDVRLPIEQGNRNPIVKNRSWKSALQLVLLLFLIILIIYVFILIFSPSEAASFMDDEFKPSPSGPSRLEFTSNTNQSDISAEIRRVRPQSFMEPLSEEDEHIVVGETAYLCSIHGSSPSGESISMDSEIFWKNPDTGQIWEPSKTNESSQHTNSGQTGSENTVSVHAPEFPGRYQLIITVSFERSGGIIDTIELTSNTSITIHSQDDLLQYQYRALVFPLQALVTVAIIISIIQTLLMIKNE